MILQSTNHLLEKNNCKNNFDFIYDMSDNIISAMGDSKYFSIGLVDIVNSTKIVAKLCPDKIPKYYEIFLNIMAKTVYYHNGEILKIMGDGLLFYFPDSCNSYKKTGFLNTILCGFSMIEIHAKLNQVLKRYSLPKINYRISFDYGNVSIMNTSKGLVDLVGPTINICSKINDLASTNNMVIGNDLYERIKEFPEFEFEHKGTFSIDMNKSYQIFTINKK